MRLGQKKIHHPNSAIRLRPSALQDRICCPVDIITLRFMFSVELVQALHSQSIVSVDFMICQQT